MKEIERRLAALEKKVTKSEGLDADELIRVLHSSVFAWVCAAERPELGRELTEEEKLEIALRLYESGKYSFTVKDITDAIIEADKEIREEEREKNINNK